MQVGLCSVIVAFSDHMHLLFADIRFYSNVILWELFILIRGFCCLGVKQIMSGKEIDEHLNFSFQTELFQLMFASNRSSITWYMVYQIL